MRIPALTNWQVILYGLPKTIFGDILTYGGNTCEKNDTPQFVCPQNGQMGARMKKKPFRIFATLQHTIFILILGLIIVPTTTLGLISYSEYAKIITEKISTLNMNNIEQIGSNIEDVFHNIRNNSLSFYQNDMVRNYLLAEDSKEQTKAFIQLDRFILNKLAYEEYIKAVDIRRMDGTQYNSNVIVEGISDELHDQVLKLNGRADFIQDIENRYQDSYGEKMYGFARSINDINNISQPIGSMQLYLNKSDIMDLLSSSELANGSEYYIVEAGKVIISPEEKWIGTKLEDILGKVNMSQDQDCTTINIQGEAQMLTYYHLEYPDWILVHIVPLNQINREQSVIQQIIRSTIVLAILICSLMAYLMSKSVIKPLRRVAQSMKNIEQENFQITIPEVGYEEITVLVHSFNKMSNRLDELVNRIYAAEIKERDAQIKAMQAYINPHFLYNTLDTICWMSRMENAYETSHLIEALSKLFRLSVDSTERTTTVRMELEHIESYIQIQQCRFSDSIEFVMDIDESLKDCETARFILQPLVENSIIHGIEPSGKSGNITITIKRVEDKLIYIIKNDGLDADIVELEELLKHYAGGLRGLGICSINDRIQLCYGKDYGLQFVKNQPHGLQVWVIQPFIMEKRDIHDNSNDC